MQDKNAKREAKTDLGWIVAFGLAGGFFLFAILQFPSLHELACKKEEQDCFRQWVAALGGWAAVLIAIPSIFFLARQIEAATINQKINFALSARANIALSHTVKIALLECKRVIQSHHADIVKAVAVSEQLRENKTTISILCEILGRPMFGDFELRIGTPDAKFNTASIVHILSLTAKQLGKRVAETSKSAQEKDVNNLLIACREIIRNAEEYVELLEACADQYLADVNSLDALIK